jgi:hypothetical protein
MDVHTHTRSFATVYHRASTQDDPCYHCSVITANPHFQAQLTWSTGGLRATPLFHCVGELAANNVASPCAAEEVDRVRRWHVLTSS